ncbi:hypothetical protein HMPREF0602_2343, partial [Neisseria meningitidis ATCC 13091]
MYQCVNICINRRKSPYCSNCSLRPLQNSFPSRQPKPKHRFSAVFATNHSLILPKYPLNPPRIPDNQASGLPFRAAGALNLLAAFNRFKHIAFRW